MLTSYVGRNGREREGRKGEEERKVDVSEVIVEGVMRRAREGKWEGREAQDRLLGDVRRVLSVLRMAQKYSLLSILFSVTR